MKLNYQITQSWRAKLKKKSKGKKDSSYLSKPMNLLFFGITPGIRGCKGLQQRVSRKYITVNSWALPKSDDPMKLFAPDKSWT